MYSVVLFDLDGTLTESGIGITRSVAHALRKHGIEETDQAKLDRFIGPPLIDMFQQLYGFSEEEARQGVEDFREYFSVKGIFENRVYDGVEEMLQALQKAGKTCVLATSKPEEYAVQIMERFGLAKYFAKICGATMDEKRTDKAEVIAYALEGLEKENVIMVGDREHDVLGARANGLETIGVLYGYGSREELEQAGAAHMADTPMDILKYI